MCSTRMRWVARNLSISSSASFASPRNIRQRSAISVLPPLGLSPRLSSVAILAGALGGLRERLPFLAGRCRGHRVGDAPQQECVTVGDGLRAQRRQPIGGAGLAEEVDRLEAPPFPEVGLGELECLRRRLLAFDEMPARQRIRELASGHGLLSSAARTGRPTATTPRCRLA